MKKIAIIEDDLDICKMIAKIEEANYHGGILTISVGFSLWNSMENR